MSNIDSIDPKRVEQSNVMRHQYRVLNDAEKQLMTEVKDLGVAFLKKLEEIGLSKPRPARPGGGQSSRGLSIAQTKIEEAVMWAVKDLTS